MDSVSLPDHVRDYVASLHEPNHFGDCPICRRNDGYVNVGKSHYFVCHEHKVYWCVGANLFSSWRDETEGDWKNASDMLDVYKEVEPVFSAEHKAKAAQADE